MGALQNLSCLAAKQLLAGAIKAVGTHTGGIGLDGLAGFLGDRFSDHSLKLPAALTRANERAWTALEVALDGESLWRIADKSDDKAFRQHIRTFLDATPLDGLPAHGAEFRQQCLRELRAARKVGLLCSGTVDLPQLARQIAGFARFSDPQELLAAELHVLSFVADELRQASHGSLAYLVTLRDNGGPPL